MPIKQLYLTPTHPFYDEFITLENQKLLLYCYFTEGSTDQLTVRAKMCQFTFLYAALFSLSYFSSVPVGPTNYN